MREPELEASHLPGALRLNSTAKISPADRIVQDKQIQVVCVKVPQRLLELHRADRQQQAAAPGGRVRIRVSIRANFRRLTDADRGT